MKKTWSFFSNTFEVNTRKAYNKALKIGQDHLSRLHAEISIAFFLALYTFFNPIFQAYSDKYSIWKSSIAARMGKRLALENNFKLLAKPWIRQWQRKTYDIIDEDSPADMALFPNGREPFQTYPYDDRIQAVKTLGKAMEAYPDLDDIRADVEAKYLILTTARDEQKQATEFTAKYLDNLEAQRIILTDALYKNLAGIMGEFYEKPTNGERFFDLTLLRRPSTDADSMFSYDAEVDAGTSVVIAIPKKFEMSINASFIFANSEGGSELNVFFAESASVTDSPNKAVILPGDTLEVKAGEIGWNTGKSILIARNVGEITSEFAMTAIESEG